ncbi:hypothetical protein P168DRAFT_142532 [Aspergillus campestris IBT 28561]|uniref:Uncharacterized protein n=1 Tax=Aspergillus campestris (strain IBT 28561) TaxID=1392248 RepID=A0A2I1D528_ASPC2|nr:uncharacterized protein P168DRAFT_142532 [Aspergillus campestris IBT 28561]PKY04979.1 hypothetical protein P168DRAFT_142532 [Aspergillus campestris IBT 28561]
MRQRKQGRVTFDQEKFQNKELSAHVTLGLDLCGREMRSRGDSMVEFRSSEGKVLRRGALDRILGGRRIQSGLTCEPPGCSRISPFHTCLQFLVVCPEHGSAVGLLTSGLVMIGCLLPTTSYPCIHVKTKMVTLFVFDPMMIMPGAVRGTWPGCI